MCVAVLPFSSLCVVKFHCNVYPCHFVLQELYKKVRSILNKLTPQWFQTLVQQIMDLEIDNEERLKGTIDLVFEKVS